MNRRAVFGKLLPTLFLIFFCHRLLAATWYVRPDGGTRYSTNQTKGECDGRSDARYPGKGVNQHCAFKDVRYLYSDGSYVKRDSFPSWGWVGQGGDTYLIRGSIGTGVTYRIGWNNNTNAYDNPTGQYWGVGGDPYDSFMPPPPSGTATQHTVIEGENFANCSAASAKTQLHGGYGLYVVLDMEGVSYTDVRCLDITDFSQCSRGNSDDPCNNNPGSLTDDAREGISWSKNSTYDTLTDVHIHGISGVGMIGPTGTGMVFNRLDLIGNGLSGWNADAGGGSTGSGTLLVQNYNISWNGCAEEYPIVDPLPYKYCSDDNSAGYGDGFGTASADSNPAWIVKFDHGVVSYNTQDGLDALHIGGAGSSMTVTHTLAYGNMGQQVKIGGAAGVVEDNQIVTNCNALRERIPGTPEGYNSKLSDFCRAADAGIAISVNNVTPLKFVSNVIYSASATGIELDCATPNCGTSARIDFRNNIFIGFHNDASHGYVGGGSGEYSNPVYIGPKINPFRNAGSIDTGNVVFYPGTGKTCPLRGEKVGVCRDPHLVDESWHKYGYGNMSLSPGAPSPASAEGADLGWSNQIDLHTPLTSSGGSSRRHALECLGAGVLAIAAWQGTRRGQG